MQREAASENFESVRGRRTGQEAGKGDIQTGWRNNMAYIKATADMVDAVYNVLQTTIKTVYPKYYPKEVTDFFCRHHSREHVSCH